MSNYSAAVMALSPLAYWRLGEASGTTAVDETGNYDATYLNTPTLGATGLLTNDTDTAITLNGTDECVQTPFLWPAIATASFSCLFSFPASSTGVDVIFGDLAATGANAHSRVMFGLYNKTAWYLNVGNGTAYYLSGGAVTNGLTPDTVYHLAVTINGTAIKIYIDGQLQHTFTSTVSFGAAGADAVYLGRYGAYNSGHYQGSLDEAAFFNIELSQAQVTALYNAATETGLHLIGTITENLSVSRWLARAYRLDNGSLVASNDNCTTGFDLTIPVADNVPLTVTVSPYQGDEWQPGAAYALNDLVFPSDPSTTPYYYQCMSAGTASTSEPTWPTTPAGQVVDGGVTWELVERLIQPITHAPLMAV